MTDYATIDLLLPDDAHNVRRHRKDPTPDLLASIEAKGIIEPLLVRKNGDGLLVENGERRRRAVLQLAQQGKWAPDRLIPIHITDERLSGRDISLTTAIVRAGLHPVDEYEAFAELVAEGGTADTIAREYGMSEKAVRQSLALGNLAPVIRDAWRAGEMKQETAQAYTTAGDVEAQTGLFGKLKKKGMESRDWEVRRALADQSKEHAAKLVTIVGAEKYRAAGGRISEDLFGDHHVVHDVKLAQKLYDEHIEATCAALLAEGWSWAGEADKLGVDYSWPQIHPAKPKPTKAEKARLDEIAAKERADDNDDEDWDALDAEKEAIEAAIAARSFSAEDKARAGCAIKINYDGRLIVTRGLLKPAEARKERARERKEILKDAGAAPEGALSNALMQRLSEQLTEAAAAAIVAPASADIALAALIAGFQAYRHESPLKVEQNGLATVKGRNFHTERPPFAETFKAALALSRDGKIIALAGIASAALNFQVMHASHPPLGESNDGVRELCESIDPAIMKVALLAHFDVADYFAAVNMALLKKACAEMNVLTGVPSRKAEAAEYAARLARDRGWLPPELRTAAYDGPAAPSVAESAPAKKRARKSAPAEAA